MRIEHDGLAFLHPLHRGCVWRGRLIAGGGKRVQGEGRARQADDRDGGEKKFSHECTCWLKHCVVRRISAHESQRRICRAPASCRSALDADLSVGRSIEKRHARQMAKPGARSPPSERAQLKARWTRIMEERRRAALSSPTDRRDRESTE